MKAIRVTEDTHGKIMDMRDRELKNAGQVVDNILMRIDDVETAPVAASSGHCQQCEIYKRQLETANEMGRKIQQRLESKEFVCKEGIDIENKLREEIKAFQDELVAAKAEIEELKQNAEPESAPVQQDSKGIQFDPNMDAKTQNAYLNEQTKKQEENEQSEE